MPLGIHVLDNRVEVSASNEDQNLLDNNVAMDTVFNVVSQSTDTQPLIEANPPIVDIGDEVSVRVQVLLPIVSWDIWVYLADGQIDSSYADDFIAATPLTPNEWYDIDLAYTNTRLITSAEEEQIIFELRTIDIFGELKTARAIVRVESNNNMSLDRNVFVPDQDAELGINFKLSSNRVALLEIYDITGTKISKIDESPYQAGWNIYYWDGITDNGQKIGSGFYIITIRSGTFTDWKKVMIVR